MAKIKYDVSDVEDSGGGGTELPKLPGVYPAKIVAGEQRTQKANGDPANDIKLQFTIGENYRHAYTYIGLEESSAWKLKEFVTALGLKEAGVIDTDKLAGKMLRIQLKADTYDGEPTMRVGKLMKGKPGDTLLDDGDDAAGEEPEDGPDDGPESEGEGEGENYDSWDLEELKEEVETRGLTVAGRKTKEKLIAALVADDEASDEPEDEGDEPESEDDAEGDDYDEWEQDELIDEVETRGIKVTGRKTKEKLIAALRADDADPFNG